MAARTARIAITAGEPAGIGPDLVAQLARNASDAERVVIGNAELLRERAHALRIDLDIREFDPGSDPEPQSAGTIRVRDVALPARVTPGRLDRSNAVHVIEMLACASDGCMDGSWDAMVTAPVHKGIINDAGTVFSGHTEFLGERSGGHPVMMLVAGTLRVALVTTHLPLREVADAITSERIESIALTLDHDLGTRFGIERPRIAVLGLNPHAGEGGHLGTEERDIIEPTLDALRGRGLRLNGPLPADTAFTPTNLAQCDAVLAMYHDQGLPVLKHVGFGGAVNVTLGLPFVRTSVDHGTALDLAGTGRADPGSLIAAFNLACELASA